MSQTKDNIIKNAIILFLITVIAGGLLGITYEVTKEPIKVQQKIKKEEALQSVIPKASFEEMSVDLADYPNISSVYEATIDGQIAGYAFELIAPEGYGGDIQLMAAIGADGLVKGIDVIKHAETPGLGAKADEPEFKSNFVDKPAAQLNVVKGDAANDNDIVSISGATITSRAVTNVVNDAIAFYQDEIGQVN